MLVEFLFGDLSLLSKFLSLPELTTSGTKEISIWKEMRIVIGSSMRRIQWLESLLYSSFASAAAAELSSLVSQSTRQLLNMLPKT